MHLLFKLYTLTALLALSNAGSVSYSLTLSKTMTNVAGDWPKQQVLVNNQNPGPAIRGKFGDWFNVKLANNFGDALSLMHWHGMSQRNTQYEDGPPGITQCLVNTKDSTGKLISPANKVTTMNYRFLPQNPGTYFYHGHYDSQIVDGLFGPLIVEDTPKITAAYAANGVSYGAETTLMLYDMYVNKSTDYIPFYLSPASGGDEPMPDYIAVNNKRTNSMVIKVDRKKSLRVRLINTAAWSQYSVSVDGMPLTVIELDAMQVKPFDVSSIPIDSAQRVSFVLDWSKLDPALGASPSITFRVTANAKMYPPYNPADPNLGLYSTATGKPFSVNWSGQFQFSLGAPTYDVTKPPASKAPAPSDSNLLSAQLLFPQAVPAPDLKVDYLIEFYNNAQGANRPHINGASNTGTTLLQDTRLPMLHEYMQKGGGPLKEPVNLPVGANIPGSGTQPFVLPFGRTVDVLFNNTDGGGHPMHFHGHNFWVIQTSEYTPVSPILRDVVTVPAVGWALIRFKADNPGIWLMHCHIDWHIVAGFNSVFIEAPSKLAGKYNTIPAENLAVCGVKANNLR